MSWLCEFGEQASCRCTQQVPDGLLQVEVVELYESSEEILGVLARSQRCPVTRSLGRGEKQLRIELAEQHRQKEYFVVALRLVVLTQRPQQSCLNIFVQAVVEPCT